MVVFATVALGMGVNFVGLNRMVHQLRLKITSRKVGELAEVGIQLNQHAVYWKPSDAPLRQDLLNPRNAELAAVRHYLQNDEECHRKQLLHYFDSNLEVDEDRETLCVVMCVQTEWFV